MDIFEKENDYAQEGLFIESRQLSWLVSVLLIFGFFIFWAGYFLGQKKVLAQFAHTIEDRLSLPHEPVQSVTFEPDELDTNHLSGAAASHEESINLIIPKEHYYAQLASFDSRAEAERLAAQLRTWDVEIVIKERYARTAPGVQKCWYQVVTDLFTNKEELVSLVDTLTKQEKLRDICYICC